MYVDEQVDDGVLRSALFLRLRSGLGVSNDELARLLQCSADQKIHLIRSEKGEPVGYMAYALISKDTLYVLAKYDLEQIRNYELNEGGILYVMDMVIARDHSRLGIYAIEEQIKKRRLVCGKKNGLFKIYCRKNGKFRRMQLDVRKREGEVLSKSKKYLELTHHRVGA